MSCETYVHYIDADGHKRTKLDNTFGTGTSLSNVAQWIQQWLKGTYSFDIEIWSSDINQWVDFDDDYLKQQNPYNNQKEVHLSVLRTSGKVFQEDRFL